MAMEFRRSFKVGRAEDQKRLAERIDRSTRMGMIGAMRAATALYGAYPDVDWEHGFDWESDILQGFDYDARTMGMGKRFELFWNRFTAKTGYEKPPTKSEIESQIATAESMAAENAAEGLVKYKLAGNVQTAITEGVSGKEVARQWANGLRLNWMKYDAQTRTMIHDELDRLIERTDPGPGREAYEFAKMAIPDRPPETALRTRPPPKRKPKVAPQPAPTPQPTTTATQPTQTVETILTGILNQLQKLNTRVESIEKGEWLGVPKPEMPTPPTPPIKLEKMLTELNKRLDTLTIETQRTKTTKEELTKMMKEGITSALGMIEEGEEPGIGLPPRKHMLEPTTDPYSQEQHLIDKELAERLTTTYHVHVGKTLKILDPVLRLPREMFDMTWASQVKRYGAPWQIYIADKLYAGETFFEKPGGVTRPRKRIGITTDELKERGLDDQDIQMFWDTIYSMPDRYPPTMLHRGKLIVER